LVLGSFSDWQSVRVDEDVAAEDVETYIAAAAKSHGIDPIKSFPFEVRGNIGPYVMHVNASAIAGRTAWDCRWRLRWSMKATGSTAYYLRF